MKRLGIKRVKDAGETLLSARYHYMQRKLAKNALKHIEAEKGRTLKKMICLCDHYARDVLGWKGYAPWLWVYTALAGSFKEGWIPDNYYGQVVVPQRQGAYGNVSHLKAFHPQIFPNGDFPDLAYHVNGFFVSRDYTVLNPAQLEELLFRDREEVVFKKDLSYQGKGVTFLSRDDFRRIKVRSLGNGVFQKVIVQHPSLAALMPSSVATIRLTTVMEDNGQVSLRAAYLRLGRSNTRYVQSASHIRIPVNLDTGQLLEEGYFPNWRTTRIHPDSQLPFEGKSLPGFQECGAAVRKLHEKLPLTRCVGWDVAVDRDEKMQVMEWNGADNDIKFSEATQGPCFADLGWEQLWRT